MHQIILYINLILQVHLGLNLDTGELIAVKQISLEGQQDKEVEAIEYEVRLLRNLRHESTVFLFVCLFVVVVFLYCFLNILLCLI